MTPVLDRDWTAVWTGVVVALAGATTVGQVMRWRVATPAARTTVVNINARIRSWWVMTAVYTVATLFGRSGAVLLFACVSIVALREFVTLIPSRRADRGALLFCFFICLPLQYVLLAASAHGLFSIFIPVIGFLCLSACTAMSGDTARFLERIADAYWGLMVCVYCVSHAPALLMLEIPAYAGQDAKLLFFLLVVTETSDVLQYIWGKLCGRHAIAPAVSPNKTVEGFLGGVGCATLLGAALFWMTPFTPWQAAAISLTVTLTGFVGGLIMSAIKRDRGVKDFGTVIAGHGGMLDRIDSLCFAAPVFFQITRYFFCT
jgi:phosphatidate cytidylyltransferase